MIRSIFTRDRPRTSDPRVADAVAAHELKFGDTVPTGTYPDMTVNLPLVDPTRVEAPVLLMRGEFDGIANRAAGWHVAHAFLTLSPRVPS